jgi:heme-degrading monooxygenase HmoA
LQVAATLFLPLTWAITPIIAFTVFKVTRIPAEVMGWKTFDPAPGIITGRFSAMMPPNGVTSQNEKKGSAAGDEDYEADVEVEHAGLTVFLLGFQSSHPLGKAGPGVAEIGQYAQAMWEDCESNRATNGFLGKTPPLLTTDSERSNALFSISYWRSLEDLRKFSQGESHMKGWRWYDRVAKKYPHIGISHEIYECPASNWESIYHRRFGIASTEYQVEGELGELERKPARLVTKGKRMGGMMSRMGKPL